MSILLPGELVTVLDLLGFTWPQADEDKLEDCARAWRDFADEVEHVLADADRVARAVVAENHGASIAAFEDYWPRLGGGSGQLCEAADAARLVAEVLEGFADAVRVAKGLVLAQLGLAAASLAAGPLSAVAQQGFRLAIRKALDELLERVVTSLLPRLKSEVGEVFERILREPRKHLEDFADNLRASLQGMGGPPLALAGDAPAGALSRQLDDLTHVETGGGGPNLMAMLSGKGGGGAGKRSQLVRQDDDFASPVSNRGLRKSRFDPDVGLIPANPDGNITPLQHVLGGRNKQPKENSQFTSFALEDGQGKIYGAQEIRLDYQRLQADIDSGKVKDVEIWPPERVQESIQGEIDKVAGKQVEVTLPHDASPQEVQQFAEDLGLSKSKTERLIPRIQALLNSQRDSEWLVSGIVPKEYITGPYPTARL
ncbi:hypothetical protein C3Y87_18975 [Carbonactinospora thermoautotrophica]|uniref:WXG100 family type VII secretion target n=1 Tax=Carbonactinospora thermoautotrophica TaxID=1469144 RepID=UPI00226E47BC|nr:hypothetical protein [Carbonactinospora thermoautotrophica]MCX9193441.1 hypothetical protein [Carbonactinospora thermoautotrophica]